VVAPIASRVMAPVTAVNVRAGDRVRRGAPLVRLDAREVQAHLARAAASVAAASESAAAADTDVAAAEANVRLARATYQRIAQLAEKKSATPQELDQATAADTAAAAQLRGAEARRLAARASLDAVRASQDAAQAAVGYAVLTAPFDGVITERSIDPGAMATPGTPLLTLEDVSRFRLDVRVDESRAAQVAVGQSVDVVLDATSGSGPPVTGHVAEIARIDPAAHAFIVKIDLPEAAALRSGAFGRARFHGPARQALTVPPTALVRRGQLTFVFVVGADSRAHLRAVSVGAGTADTVEVLAGITAGEAVVRAPAPALVDGSPVQVAQRAAQGDAR
jgi:RND family efflux transporter MFP subunit